MLSVDLILGIITLGLLDLESGGLQVQLQDLVLDFSDLQGGSSSATCGRNGIVETVSLGSLGCLAGSLEDSQVGSRNASKVGSVNLSFVSIKEP